MGRLASAPMNDRPFSPSRYFTREFDRHRWRQLEVKAPDVTWGNSPDPLGHWTIQAGKVKEWGNILVFENVRR